MKRLFAEVYASATSGQFLLLLGGGDRPVGVRAYDSSPLRSFRENLPCSG
jgi:hypothetical protein